MAYTEHVVVKSKEVVEAAHTLVEAELTLPKIFSREVADKFEGRENDKIIFRVPGRLPWRTYEFRNDRTNSIVYDIYKEGTAEIGYMGHIYQGVMITDEQRDFDFQGADSRGGRILAAQTKAVAQGMNQTAAKALKEAPFEVTIGGAEAALRSAIIEARRVLNKFRVPDGSRYLIVGSDFEAAMLGDPTLTFANAVGDSVAQSAIQSANLGRNSGFTVISSPLIDDDTAYAIVPSAFGMMTGAPSIPAGIEGEMLSEQGFALRWLRSYDQDRFVGRSTVDTWAGAAPIKDRFLPASKEETGTTPVSYNPEDLKEYFVRGVKITLGGTSQYPNKAQKKDLVDETGVSADKAWKAPKAAGGGGQVGP